MNKKEQMISTEQFIRNQAEWLLKYSYKCWNPVKMYRLTYNISQTLTKRADIIAKGDYHGS